MRRRNTSAWKRSKTSQPRCDYLNAGRKRPAFLLSVKRQGRERLRRALIFRVRLPKKRSGLDGVSPCGKLVHGPDARPIFEVEALHEPSNLPSGFGLRRRSLRSRRFRLRGTDGGEHRSLGRCPSKAVTSPTPSPQSRTLRDNRGCCEVPQSRQNNQRCRAQCHSSAQTGQFNIAVAGDRDWTPGRAGKEKLAWQTLSDRQKLV